MSPLVCIIHFQSISNTLQDKWNEQDTEIWCVLWDQSMLVFMCLNIKGPFCIGPPDITAWAGAKWYILTSSKNHAVLLGQPMSTKMQWAVVASWQCRTVNNGKLSSDICSCFAQKFWISPCFYKPLSLFKKSLLSMENV